MENKISIIVPVYNVEKYIGKCLESLVKQDYSNYDILVVNDGSPFNEQAIIDEYVKKYPSIIKSIVKENGGYGSVLQLAFNESDADYILVCDPDDYLADDALSTLISYQKKDDVDLVVGAKNLVYEDSDTEVIKQSASSMISTLSGMVFATIIIAILFTIESKYISLIITFIIAILTFISYKVLIVYGDNRFKEIN